jgi:hypothetical protein
VPPTLVAALALSSAVAWAVPLLLALPVAYLTGVAATSGWLAGRRPTRAPRIAAALATLHLAYGAGFWAGLAAFVGRPYRRASTTPERGGSVSGAP